MENAMEQKTLTKFLQEEGILIPVEELVALVQGVAAAPKGCLLYTSDAADE